MPTCTVIRSVPLSVLHVERSASCIVVVLDKRSFCLPFTCIMQCFFLINVVDNEEQHSDYISGTRCSSFRGFLLRPDVPNPMQEYRSLHSSENTNRIKTCNFHLFIQIDEITCKKKKTRTSHPTFFLYFFFFFVFFQDNSIYTSSMMQDVN